MLPFVFLVFSESMSRAGTKAGEDTEAAMSFEILHFLNYLILSPDLLLSLGFYCLSLHNIFLVASQMGT